MCARFRALALDEDTVSAKIPPGNRWGTVTRVLGNRITASPGPRKSQTPRRWLWQGRRREGCAWPKTRKENPANGRVESSGSPGRIRTCDTLINSQLRYHCATGEYVVRCLRARKNYTGNCGACNPEFQKNWDFERTASQRPNKIEVKAADPSSVSLQAPSAF